MSRRIGHLIGHGISPIVESLDVNAIVSEVDFDEVIQRIDIDKLMDRINVNQLLDRVDWNAILERVDINRHLDRIDMDRLLDQVDVDRIIERSNLEEIISRATGGVFAEFVDLVRTRLAWIDQWGQRFCRLRCFSKNPYLPPRPGRPQDNETIWPKRLGLRARKFGMAVQFRTCGGICRSASTFVDVVFVATTFAIWTTLGTWVARVIMDDPLWTMDDDWEWLMTFFYLLYNLLYHLCMLGCFSRTIGMWVLGLLMVSWDGHRVQFYQVFLHSFFQPFNVPLFGWVLTFFRRDGKMWNELIACTVLVYAWNVRTLTSRHAEFALSLNEYTGMLPPHSTSRRMLFQNNNDTDENFSSTSNGGSQLGNKGKVDLFYDVEEQVQH
ncbi:RDD family protein [Nitzschia inconspicua]|uniref:RDD family protein n=1 Tax=Nitzschia inconspicua TaxID=303405 RepID=A0A9K3L3Y3_9STRA|nr:RDD family protein [Nitzschia inconspicua]